MSRSDLVRGDRVRLVGDTFLRMREVAALGRERVPSKPLATVLEVGEWKVLVRFDDSASVYPIPPRRLVRA